MRGYLSLTGATAQPAERVAARPSIQYRRWGGISNALATTWRRPSAPRIECRRRFYARLTTVQTRIATHSHDRRATHSVRGSATEQLR